MVTVSILAYRRNQVKRFFSKSDSFFRTSKKIYETVGILNQNRFDVKPFFSHLLKRWVNFPGPTGPVCSQTHC